MKTFVTKNKTVLFSHSLILFLLIFGFNANSQNGVGVNTITPKSNFEVNGSFGQTVTTVTSNTTLDGTQSLILCNNGSTSITLTLPSVSLCSGRIYTIKKNTTSTANVTISGTIDGETNMILNGSGEAVTIFSNGTEWKTMQNYNSQSAWNISGNSGIDSTTDFIGTNDAKPLVLKTSNSSRINISSTGSVVIGGATNHVKIEADGTLILEGTATTWEDLRVSLDKGTDAASLTYLSGSSGPQIYYFRNNQAVEAMSFTVQLPHGWKEGSTIYPHIHWIPKGSSSGNVEWNLEYTWANWDEASPQAFPAITTSTVVANGPFTAYTHLITKLTTNNVGINASGKTVSSVLICRIWRNSSNSADTYNNDAGLISLDFHYEINSMGSHEEYVK